MHLENFLQFLIRHNALIIESLVALIVVAVLYLSYRAFSVAKTAELGGAAGAPSLGQLEEALKKILEKANGLPAAGATQETTPLLNEIAELKKNLEVKQSELEQLKAVSPADGAAAGAAPGMSADDRAALEKQIQELQAKLSEYEIISEDIADLSRYKEENARLNQELQSLKAGGAPAAAPAAAPAPAAPAPEAAAVPAPPTEPPPVPAPSKEAQEAKAQEAAEATAAVAAAPAPAAEPAAPAADAATMEALSELTPAPQAVAESASATAVVDDDIMKEFAAAVQEQKGPGAPAAAPEEKPAAATEPAAPAGVDLGNMDMDKMVAEAMNLDPSAAPDANALESEMDPNKLMAEAATMEAVKPEDAQLMGDFEKFVKKG